MSLVVSSSNPQIHDSTELFRKSNNKVDICTMGRAKTKVSAICSGKNQQTNIIYFVLVWTGYKYANLCLHHQF